MEKEFSKEEMVKEAVEEAKKAAKEQQTEMEETSEEVTDEELAEEKDSEAGEDGAEKKDKKLFKRKPKKDKKDEQIEELTDRLTRQMAEFDNFRKRTEKEKAQMFEVGAKSIIEKILPVIDNFERGLASIPEEEAGSAFADGMNMIYKQLMNELEQAGVAPIEANIPYCLVFWLIDIAKLLLIHTAEVIIIITITTAAILYTNATLES